MTMFSKSSTVAVKVTCAIVFLLFTFLFLYNFQADLLAAAQHVLSKGATNYNRVVGAVLITLVLWLLQIGVYFVTKLDKRMHACTYFPSLLILTIITDISPTIDRDFSFGGWLWAFPLLLVLFGGLVWMAIQLQPYETGNASYGFFSKTMWTNLALMAGMLFLVGLFTNHDDVFHYRMTAEQAMVDGDYDKAIAVGKKAHATDSCLTMIRIAALSEKGKLGEELFEYPLTGGSMAMLPDGKRTRFLIYQERKLYKSLGGWFKQYMPPRQYLSFLFKHQQQTQKAVDYLLCAYLLDRQLDKFVQALKKYGDVNSKALPKHYREALTLYNHLRSNPEVVYHSNVMDADFQDYESLNHKYKDSAQERYTEIRSTYGNTYWCYYQYGYRE